MKALGAAAMFCVSLAAAAGVRVELGRRLFYDRRMSVNGATSCATCHRQDLAFTGRSLRRSPGWACSGCFAVSSDPTGPPRG